MTIELHHGDCLEIMRTLPSGSVDLVLVDLPYGVTQQKWDAVIPFAPLWEQYLRITKDNAAFVFTASQPFTSALVMSMPKLFKYDWVWKKPKGTGHLNAKKQPMRDKEDILVFAKGKPVYNPQMVKGEPYKARGGKRNDDTYGDYTSVRNDNEGLRYPKQIIEFAIVERDKLHPSQKPLELMQYLVRTYSNPGDVVLDNTMGSGSTGAACIREGRDFIGIEMDEGYFEVAKLRLHLELEKVLL
jgi:DNA modification methylase